MKKETEVIDKALSIAIVAAMINIIFSSVFPCLMRKTKRKSLSRDIKITFMVHRHVLVASSMVTAIMVYFAVKFEPNLINKTLPNILNFLN